MHKMLPSTDERRSEMLLLLVVLVLTASFAAVVPLVAAVEIVESGTTTVEAVKQRAGTSMAGGKEGDGTAGESAVPVAIA